MQGAKDIQLKDGLPNTELCSTSMKPGSKDFSQSFMYNLHQIFFLLEKYLDATLLKQKHISFSQFMVLVGFDCHNTKNISQKMIAEKLHLTEATVSRHVSTLVTLGYITQSIDKDNRRKKLISITTKGKSAFEKAKDTVNKELSVLFSVISKQDRTIILDNFSQVLKQLLTKK